ncbi:hypothetical protein KKA89_01745, partial [Patescibacteria group bacterium]|nr:hypothetical protein [Patescibacteria group bacterium]
MFLKKTTKVSVIILGLLLFTVVVFGYDHLITHPKLTNGAITIYNNQTSNKLTNQQQNWIVEGSIAEDTDPRYLNHYYDPTTGQGLNGGISAKQWAQVQGSISGDYSEKAILENYKQGNYKRAYQGVGHILHLIQDMSVPAHTRNDS